LQQADPFHAVGCIRARRRAGAARRSGATVIATAQPGDEENFVRDLGASHGVDYTGDVAEQVREIRPGGVASGWAEVGERWEWVASQFVPGAGEVTSETAFLTVNGAMAYGVFIERWRGQFKSRPEPIELMIRATLIFRREDGEWKAVHRHGDNAVEKAPPS
jgi:ketosteroid isomerase-like protein